MRNQTNLANNGSNSELATGTDTVTEDGVLVINSHLIAIEMYKRLRNKGHRIVSTCVPNSYSGTKEMRETILFFQ